MKVTVCRPAELGDAELERWRHILVGAPTLRHPFLSAEFAQALGQVSDRARVAVVEDGHDIAGFFAFDRTALGVAKPLAGRLAYRQAFVHVPELEWSWRELLAASGLRAIEFTDLVMEQAAGEKQLELNDSPVIDTSNGWEHYRANIKGRRIKNTMYLARRLEREVGPVRFTWGPSCKPAFDQLIAWKSEQYRRSGWSDPFARRWVREFLEQIVGDPTGRLRPVFSTLQAGDRLLAADLSVSYDDVYAGWFTAYNPEYSFYSPGAIRMLRTVERAANDGMRYIDLARGDENYKRSFKNAYVQVGTGVVHGHSPSALLYRTVRAPSHAARSYILNRPRVRTFVRTSLRRYGALRTRFTPKR